VKVKSSVIIECLLASDTTFIIIFTEPRTKKFHVKVSGRKDG